MSFGFKNENVLVNAVLDCIGINIGLESRPYELVQNRGTPHISEGDGIEKLSNPIRELDPPV